MSHFYGSVQGNRGQVTRGGSKASGYEAVAASWSGGVRTILRDVDGVTHAEVRLIPWRGVGVSHLIYDGPVAPDNIYVDYDGSLVDMVDATLVGE